MLRKTILSLLACCWMCGMLAQTEQVTSSTSLPAHPRLLMLKGEEKALVKKIRKDAYWKEMQANLVAECDTIIDLPVLTRQMTGRRLLGVSREALRRIFDLSYAYRTTGQKKYAQRAEQEMLVCANFTDWNPSHFLDVGEMTLALSIGYDWLHSYLSASSRQTIREAIIEKGIKQSFDKWYLEATNNWNQVCNAGITFGCLATFEDCKELAAERINTAFKTLPLAMEGYAPDGAYPEGPGYWSYGTSFNVLFIAAIEKALGSDFGLCQAPGFMATGMYKQAQLTPSGYNFNYSDNGHKAGFVPEIFWFYAKTKDPALLYMQKYMYEMNGPKSMMSNRLLPLALIYGAGSGASLASPEVPSSLMWAGKGPAPVAFMRSAWTPGSLYLGFKLGSTKAGHAHLDEGSFIFEAEGVRWACDFGGEDYNRLETRGVSLWGGGSQRWELLQRWDVFRYRTQSHNTLSFNDKQQLIDEYADLDDSGERDGVMYAMSDLSAIYKNQLPGVKRAVSLVDGKYAVIQDQFTTSKQFTKVTWNMLTMADKITFTSDTTALLEKDDKRLYLRVEAPMPVRMYVNDLTPPNTYDSPNPEGQFIRFDADLQLNATQHITVYLMPGEDMSNAKAPYKF